MKKLAVFFALCSLFFALTSCKSTERIVTKTEYVSMLKYDSIYLQKYDSVYVEKKGDTIRIERLKTVFKDRLIIQRDTVIKTDSLIFETPPKEVKIPVEINKWGFFDWVGLIALIVGALLIAFNLLVGSWFKALD